MPVKLDPANPAAEIPTLLEAVGIAFPPLTPPPPRIANWEDIALKRGREPGRFPGQGYKLTWSLAHVLHVEAYWGQSREAQGHGSGHGSCQVGSQLPLPTPEHRTW